jgi:AcrR family transcriptional regulator
MCRMSPSVTGEPAAPSARARPGIRERNRERNRQEVADVALDLFTRHGYPAVTVDDIAAAAGISRRTFFRYFESKEDVVMPAEEERDLEVLRRHLDARPSGEPLVVSICNAVQILLETTTAEERAALMARLRVIFENPAVHAHMLQRQTSMEHMVAEVIAGHLGVDPATDLTSRVLAASTIAAFRAATDVWLATGGERELVDLMAEAHAVLTDSYDRAAPAD